MSTFELSASEEELSKKARLVNAWLAAEDGISPSDAAEITDASEAYASRIRSQMNSKEIAEEDVEDMRRDDLVDEYAGRFQQLAPGVGEEQPDDIDEQQTGGGESEQKGRGQKDQPGQRPHSPRQPPQQQPQTAPRKGEDRQYSDTHQHPPQAGQQPQQQYLEIPGEDGQSVPVAQLRELDELLAFIQDEANFDLQHLPPADRGAAAGKLFVAQQARDALHSIISEHGQ